MTSPATADKRVALAAVAGAHGIKGEVRLKLFADSVDSLARHQDLFVGGDELAAPRPPRRRQDRDRPLRRARRPHRRRGAARHSWSKSTAPRCRRSRRANIITPTCRPAVRRCGGRAARHRRRGREFRRRRPARGRAARRQALADPVPRPDRRPRRRPDRPRPRIPRLALAAALSGSRSIGLTLARSLRIVVAATPPSPIAWLIWSSPMHDVARRIEARRRWCAGGSRPRCTRPRSGARRPSRRAGCACPSPAPDRCWRSHDVPSAVSTAMLSSRRLDRLDRPVDQRRRRRRSSSRAVLALERHARLSGAIRVTSAV